MGSNAVERFNAKGRKDALTFDPEQLVIVTDPKHPLFDERALWPVDENLVKNIMANGVIVPVTVTHAGVRPDGTAIIEVVDGRQRVKCAIEANKRFAAEGKVTLRLQAMHRPGDSRDLFGVMISTNELRTQDSEITRAKKVGRYLSMGRTEEEAAVQFGCTKQTIKNLLDLLEMAPEVQGAVEGGLPVAAALKMKGMDAETQKTTLAEMKEVGATKGAAASNAVAAKKRGEKIERADKSKMRSRVWLEKWCKSLKATGFEEIAHIVKFILGGPVPSELGEDLKATIEDVGGKKKKEPKPPKPPKEKKAPAKAKKGKKSP